MPLLYMKRYTREFIQAHPDWLFVFGDNIVRQGLGGQAREARGEPNAVGIPTKIRPDTRTSAYLSDLLWRDWHLASRPDFERITAHLHKGGVVIWPLDGIGTGLARMDKLAPKLWGVIEEFRLKNEVFEP